MSLGYDIKTLCLWVSWTKNAKPAKKGQRMIDGRHRHTPEFGGMQRRSNGLVAFWIIKPLPAIAADNIKTCLHYLIYIIYWYYHGLSSVLS